MPSVWGNQYGVLQRADRLEYLLVSSVWLVAAYLGRYPHTRGGEPWLALSTSALWSESLDQDQVLKRWCWVGFLTHDRHVSHSDRHTNSW